jgi:hypothetical protein
MKNNPNTWQLLIYGEALDWKEKFDDVFSFKK